MIIENNHVFLNCPCCTSDQFKTIGRIQDRGPMGFSTTQIELRHERYIDKCTKCQSTFVQNSITKADAEMLYKTGDGSRRWSGVPFEEDKPNVVVSQLQDLLQLANTVCDIGCNTGEFLDFAKARGVKTFGIELSDESNRILVEKGHKVRGTLKDFETKFDLITAFDLVEHLYAPSEFLRDVLANLKTGGHLVLLTGNTQSLPARWSRSKWWYSKYPEHVIFASKKFYQNGQGFELVRYHKTFASKLHQERKGLFSDFLLASIRNSYDGRPSFFPDHHLVVLKKV